MATPQNLLTFAKYGFLILVITGAGFLISTVVVVRHHMVALQEDLVYRPPLLLERKGTALDHNPGRCLTEPSKAFCFLSPNRQLQMLKAKQERRFPEAQTLVYPEKDVPQPSQHRHPVHQLLRVFGQMMNSVGADWVLIEPSMLFCALSPVHKFDLLTKGFKPGKWQGSRRVVTVAVSEKDAAILDQENSLSKALDAEFEISRTRKWLKLTETDDDTVMELQTTHFFFMHRTLTVHAVVLFERDGFLWHSGISADEYGLPDLLLVKASAYENFTRTPLTVDEDPSLKINLPSNPHLFLFEIQSSEFSECHADRPISLDTQRDAHPNLTTDQMTNRAAIAVQELKLVFLPRLIQFWLWNDTLSGWLERCDIFEKSVEANFCVSSAAVSSLNISELFSDNQYLRVVNQTMLESGDSQLKLDCHGLSVNIFVCSEDRVRSKEDIDRSSRSEMQLCSTSVFGGLVHVPCDKKRLMENNQTGVFPTVV